MKDTQTMRIANEFTYVELRKVQTNNGETLEVEDMKNGRKVRLDAMQLESLTLLKPEDFSFFFEIHYGINDSK